MYILTPSKRRWCVCWLRSAEIELRMFMRKLSWEMSVRKMVRDIPGADTEVGVSEKFCGLNVV